MKKRFLILIIVFLVILIVGERVIGRKLEPKLEAQLTDLFGMQVSISGLTVNPLSGHIHASRITFMNQPEFSPEPHIDTRSVDVFINLWSLRDHKVEIRKIVFHRLVYLIDRAVAPDGGVHNNVKTWYYHIKNRKKAAPGPPPDDEGSKKWEIIINKLALRDSTFIFHDRSKTPPRKFVFQKMDGFLSNFKWPTDNPSTLYQELKLVGMYGEKGEAPFTIRGRSNFANSDISFDLRGQINDGDVMEHRGLWEGLPVDIKAGRFDLEVHAICKLDKLKSQSELSLKSLQIVPGPAASDKIWGYPIKGWIRFMQQRETLRLKVPVQGDISDPKFAFNIAFRKAFQQALRDRSTSGLQLITTGVFVTPKIVLSTPKKVLESPAWVVDSLNKMKSSAKSNGTSEVNANNETLQKEELQEVKA